MTDFEVKGYKKKCGWLYSDKVKEHFFNPKNLFKSVEEVKSYEKEADGIGEVGSPACLPPQSMIISENGLIPIEEIKTKNKVLAHTSKFKKITETKKRNHTGKLVNLKTKLGNISLTPNHLVYSIRKPQNWKYNYTKYRHELAPEWNYAKNLKKNDFIIYPRLNQTSKLSSITIKTTKKKWDFKSKNLPTDIEITSELLRLFGYYIAEGSVRKKESRSTEVCFTFGIKEKEYIKDVVNLTKKYFRLDSKVIENKKSNKCSVLIYSVHLSNLFKGYFGIGAINKKIPSFLMYLPIELQNGLLAGLWRGDGYVNTVRKYPRAGYATISRELINQIKTLLLRQGIVPSIYQEKEKSSKWANHKKAYRVHIGDMDSVKKINKIVYGKDIKRTSCQKSSWFDPDLFYTPLTEVKEENYSGPVYNLEVAEEHNYTSEAFVVHNCGDVMKMFIKVKDGKITDCKWQTFGCASAIASTSMLSCMVIGKTLEEAKKIKAKDIVDELGGLPPRKIHCSVLGDQALRAAIENYEGKQK